MSRSRKVTKSEVPIESALVSLPQGWEDRLAAAVQADEAIATDVGGIPWLSLRGGSFHLQQESLESPLSVVVLGAVRENLYYKAKFDPNKPQAPDCYALGPKVDELAPGADAPNKQHENCAGCWANAFGTAERGRGKACQNKVRLVCIAWEPDLTPDRVGNAQAVRMRIPTTSLSGFSGYVKKVNKGMRRPLLSVVSRLTLEDDEKTQFRLLFDLDQPVQDGKLLAALFERAEILQPALMQSPVFVPEERGNGKTRKTKAVAKPARRRKF